MYEFIDFVISLFNQFADYCQTVFIDATFRDFHGLFTGWPM